MYVFVLDALTGAQVTGLLKLGVPNAPIQDYFTLHGSQSLLFHSNGSVFVGLDDTETSQQTASLVLGKVNLAQQSTLDYLLRSDQIEGKLAAVTRGAPGTIFEDFVYFGGSTNRFQTAGTQQGWHLAVVKVDSTISSEVQIAASASIHSLAYHGSDCASSPPVSTGYEVSMSEAPYISHISFDTTGQLFGLLEATSPTSVVNGVWRVELDQNGDVMTTGFQLTFIDRKLRFLGMHEAMYFNESE